MVSVLLFVAAIALPPKPDHYVTDRAGVLKNAAALNAKLANFERQTSDQILVYVDQHLPPDTTIEEMGSEAMRQWGVGQKAKDNGAILFVFTADRKMRIEVGYGLEGSLTDAKSKQITSTVIKPEFQRGDFDAGINNGVDAMLATIRGEAYRGSGKTAAERGDQVVFEWRHPLPQWIGCVLLFGFVVLAFGAPIVLVIFFVPRFGRWAAKNPEQYAALQRGFSSSSTGSSSSSDFGSSSSSSDSFSGGGGSGGGGGASDSW